MDCDLMMVSYKSSLVFIGTQAQARSVAVFWTTTLDSNET